LDCIAKAYEDEMGEPMKGWVDHTFKQEHIFQDEDDGEVYAIGKGDSVKFWR